jgi:cell division protein FtsL
MVATGKRSWIWLGLAGFLLVAVGVIWRRSIGIAESRQLQELVRQRDALHNERLKLESEIRAASSRARLAPLVERRLGMRLPSANQVIHLTRPSPPRSNDPQ